MDITIQTTAYEEKHGKAPHHAAKGTWTFLTPHSRRWQFAGIAYREACQALTQKAQSNEGAGVYQLLP